MVDWSTKSILEGRVEAMTACNCIGPQNGEPKCPCMMRGVTQRDGRWVEPERDLGPVTPTTPIAPYSGTPQVGCICPPGAEMTCQGPLCPRRPLFQSATS